MRGMFALKHEFRRRSVAWRWLILLVLGALAIGALAAGLSAETRTLRELHLATRLREFARSQACALHCAAHPELPKRGLSDWRADFGVIGSSIRPAPAL